MSFIRRRVEALPYTESLTYNAGSKQAAMDLLKEDFNAERTVDSVGTETYDR